MCEEKIYYIRKRISKKKVYKHWLKHISIIESLTMHDGNYDYAMSIGYLLFPLIDAISYTLFRKSGRYYLEILGIKESFLLYKIFRNGQLHNINNYILRYEDGDVSWGMGSGNSPSGITPFDPGYYDKEFPEYNQPPENVFEYTKLNNNISHASLSLDRLTAQVRYDLENRSENDSRKTIGLIIGQKLKGKRPRLNRMKATK